MIIGSHYSKENFSLVKKSWFTVIDKKSYHKEDSEFSKFYLVDLEK